uniref:40S ribosomal protein S30 n=1 Tax=Trichuris muris TaxID=70415 RepID=A0A5S6R221_TRIMR
MLPTLRVVRRFCSARSSVKERISAALSQALEPVYLEVVNDSHLHGASEQLESHFRLTVVSERFAGLSMVQRHRFHFNKHACGMGRSKPKGRSLPQKVNGCARISGRSAVQD